MNRISISLAYRNFFNGTCEEYFFSPGADMSLRSSNDGKRTNSDCTAMCTEDISPVCAESVNKVVDGEELLDFKNPCHLDNYNCLNRTARKIFGLKQLFLTHNI